MKLWFSIAAGGALGATLRYATALAMHARFGHGFPYGTLTVNVTGCLLMGLLYVLMTERLAAGPELRALLLVGVLGGFTTFSAFSMETLLLIEQGAIAKAGVNMVANVAACLIATWLGVIWGRVL